MTKNIQVLKEIIQSDLNYLFEIRKMTSYSFTAFLATIASIFGAWFWTNAPSLLIYWVPASIFLFIIWLIYSIFKLIDESKSLLKRQEKIQTQLSELDLEDKDIGYLLEPFIFFLSSLLQSFIFIYAINVVIIIYFGKFSEFLLPLIFSILLLFPLVNFNSIRKKIQEKTILDLPKLLTPRKPYQTLALAIITFILIGVLLSGSIIVSIFFLKSIHDILIVIALMGLQLISVFAIGSFLNNRETEKNIYDQINGLTLLMNRINSILLNEKESPEIFIQKIVEKYCEIRKFDFITGYFFLKLFKYHTITLSASHLIHKKIIKNKIL